MYQGGAEAAYNALDFSGRGYIMADDLLKSTAVAHLSGKVTHEDVKTCFEMHNLFRGPQTIASGKGTRPGNSMDFDSFKKIFFPHLYVLVDDPGSDDEKKARAAKSEMRQNKEKHPKVVE